jgi:hypothetical protein
MKPVVKLLLAVFCIAYLQSCREKEEERCQEPSNPECENYNPCLNAKPTSAAFTIEEIVIPQLNLDLMPHNHSLRYETDTIMRYNNEVIFTCLQKADSIWWIFDDTEMRQSWQQKQSITIRFGNIGNPEKTPVRVKITCVVKNNKPNTCFPNDNGLDTFTRYLVYMPNYQAGFIGTYTGSLTSNPDSIFNLTLRFDTLVTHQGVNIINIAFDELLSEPAYVSPITQKGFEYTRNGGGGADYGYNRAYLFFNSVSGQAGVSPNYKGRTIKGIASYDAATNTIKVDFIRHGTSIYRINEWPPQNIPLLTFIGNKL